MCKFNDSSKAGFNLEHVGKEFYGELSRMITSDVFVGLDLIAQSAI